MPGELCDSAIPVRQTPAQHAAPVEASADGEEAEAVVEAMDVDVLAELGPSSPVWTELAGAGGVILPC